MKTMKSLFLVFAMLLLAVNCNWAQKTIHQDVLVTFSGTPYGDPIGMVYGTATYHFVIKLNKDGFMERIHWCLTNCELENENGDKVKIIDTGFDNYGTYLWDFFNYPNAYNEGWNLSYAITDGWMNDVMPAQMPAEGTCNGMSFKVIVNGKVYHWYLLIQFHVNANGEVTAYVVKSAL